MNAKELIQYLSKFEEDWEVQVNSNQDEDQELSAITVIPLSKVLVLEHK